jgi:hypothetical protein
MKVLTFEEHSLVLAAWREPPRRPHTLATSTPISIYSL